MRDRPTRKSSAGESSRQFPDLKSLMEERLKVAGVSGKRIKQFTRVVESELFRIYADSLDNSNPISPVDAATISPDHLRSVTSLASAVTRQGPDRPLILLIGGVTGSGKSTLATEISRKLAIPRVVSTDFIRQRMRTLFPREMMPSIHCSSFEAGSVLPAADDRKDSTLAGFLDQARCVLMGLRAILERSLEDRCSMTIEGVHLVPGWLPALVPKAVVVPCLLASEKVEAHVSNFWIRSAASRDHRPARRYLRSLSEIRRIQDYLVEQARELGVAVIETSHREEAAESLIRLVVDRVEQSTGLRSSLQTSVSSHRLNGVRKGRAGRAN